jgi:site-specific DNA-cytosine methylase
VDLGGQRHRTVPADPGVQRLFRHVVRIAGELRARLVVLENVPGLRRVNGMGFLDCIVATLRRHYQAERYEVAAFHFGVPQKRRRLFFLARRKDLGRAPTMPDPTHRRPGTLDGAGDLPETPRLEDKLRGDLELPSGTAEERLVVFPHFCGVALLDSVLPTKRSAA